MTRAPISRAVLRWARERAGLEQPDLSHRFRKLADWKGGERLLTLRQMEAVACGRFRRWLHCRALVASAGQPGPELPYSGRSGVSDPYRVATPFACGVRGPFFLRTSRGRKQEIPSWSEQPLGSGWRLSDLEATVQWGSKSLPLRLATGMCRRRRERSGMRLELKR